MKAGWQVLRLGDVCEFEKSQGIHAGLPYVGLEDIESQTARFIGSVEPQGVKSSTFKFSTQHVLYGRLRPYLNKVFAPDFAGHCSSEIFPLMPSPALSREYLLYWLLSADTVERINATCTGARMPRANMNEVLDFDIPTPPRPEQQRIVTLLDESFAGIATAKANAEKNLQNARAIFVSYLQSLFGQRHEKWSIFALGDVCQFENGDRGKNYPNRVEYVDSGVPWINTGHIEPDGTLSVQDMNFITQQKYDSLRSGKVKPGDLVYCLRGATLGKTAFVSPFTIGAVASSLVIIRPGREIDGRFLYYFLTSPVGQGFIKHYENGAAQPNLGAKSVAAFKIPLPSLIDQSSIVRGLDALAAEVQQLESIYQQKRTALDELKKSLLHRAFNGDL